MDGRAMTSFWTGLAHRVQQGSGVAAAELRQPQNEADARQGRRRKEPITMRQILLKCAAVAGIALAIGGAARADHDGYYGGSGYGLEQRYHDQLGHNAYHRNLDHQSYHDSLNHSAFDRQLGSRSNLGGYGSSYGYGAGSQYRGYNTRGYGGFGGYGGYSTYPRNSRGW